MRLAAAVAGIAAAVAAAFVVWGLIWAGPRLAGTNSTLLGSYVATVPSGALLCQIGENVPAGAGELEVFGGVFGNPGPALALRIDGKDAGRLAPGYVDGWSRIPLSGEFRDAVEPEVRRSICIVNRGRRPVAFAGLIGAPENAARVNGVPAQGRIAMRWTAADRPSWWSQAATVAQRATFGKADLGRWMPVLLLAGVWIGALGLVARSAR